MHKAILYYTCLTHREDIEAMCRVQLLKAQGDCELVSVSRGAPIAFGTNVTVEGERGPLTMHYQILAGLRVATAPIVFLCESDVLYHASHFNFVPPSNDTFYYNTNVWKVRYPDGFAVWSDDLQQVSGVCAERELLLDFYSKRVAQIERDGFNRHYEPGVKQSTGSGKVENRMSDSPNLCIRHDANLTRSKWAPSEFRNARYAQGWREAYEVEGWGDTRLMFQQPILMTLTQ